MPAYNVKGASRGCSGFWSTPLNFQSDDVLILLILAFLLQIDITMKEVPKNTFIIFQRSNISTPTFYI